MSQYIYEKIAQEISTAIRKGVYSIGEKMPSLRFVSQHYGVSLSTAIQTYQMLENEGYIEARPKSGYYVKSWLVNYHAEPGPTQSSSKPATINIGQLALSLIEESQSKNLIKLGAAVPDQSLLPVRALSRTLAAVARKYSDLPAVYETVKGVLLLRRQIARLMRQAGCSCSPQDIIITNGCLEGLTLSLKATTKPGETVAVESPTYFGILQVLESLGLNALEIATHSTHGIEPDALQNAIENTQISACILMPNFSNPLGSQMPEANKKRVIEITQNANIPVIEDDVHGALGYQLPRPKALKAYDKNNNVILCSSFSKTIAPGYRIGWVLTSRYTQQIEYHKFLGNISTATLPQFTFAEFLAKGGFQRAVQKSIKIYRIRMEKMRRIISQKFPKETRISDPSGGFVLWVELPKTIDCMTLYEKALNRNIAISPGILFSPRTEHKSHIRLNCAATDEEKMEFALIVLGDLVFEMLEK